MAKPDEAVRKTQEYLDELEKRVAAEYSKAAREMDSEVQKYFAQFQARDAQMQARLQAGEITQQYYQQWRLNQMGRGERMEAMRDKLSGRYADAAQVANAYINDATPGIYSLNRNFAAYDIEQKCGRDIGFDLLDEQTVRRLIEEQPDLMPYYSPQKARDRGFDLEFGKKQISKQVTTGILMGEGIPKIADRLQTNIPTMMRNSAIRAARTAVTGAQNAGRMDSYSAAEEMGINIMKEWLATLDDRTRHTHAAIDGEAVGVKEYFSNGCMYPGDPQGEAAEVYNCRCTMVSNIQGINTTNTQRIARDENGQNVIIEDMTYSEWADWKEQNHRVFRPGSPVAQKSENKAAAKSFFKPVSIPGLSEKEQEEINRYFQQLDSIYHARIDGVEDLLSNMQRDYDARFEATVKNRMEQNPKRRRKTIEKEVREQMGPRPEAGSMQVAMYGGTFDYKSRIMTLNPSSVGYSSFAEDQEHRLATRARWERRGRKEYNNFSNVPSSAAGNFLHEYGHAIDSEYSITENPAFIDLYTRYSKEDIEHGLSTYASENPQEFIAEAFCESFYQDQGDISKEFMKILGGIVDGKR